MLAAKVEDMINTVVRQIAFYNFERKVHTERKQRRTHRRAARRALAGGAGAKASGPAIELKPGYEMFWTYIPHFIHSPFYVYAYAFGDCLVNSLYAVYENADERLRRALSRDAGGRRHQAPFRAAGAVRARRPRPGLLAGRAWRDRADDRRAGGAGVELCACARSGSNAALNGAWTRERATGDAGFRRGDRRRRHRWAKAGAAIVHLHAYDVSTGRQRDDYGIYALIIEGIRAKVDAIVYPTLPISGSGYAGELRSAKERYITSNELAQNGLAESGD